MLVGGTVMVRHCRTGWRGQMSSVGIRKCCRKSTDLEYGAAGFRRRRAVFAGRRQSSRKKRATKSWRLKSCLLLALSRHRQSAECPLGATSGRSETAAGARSRVRTVWCYGLRLAIERRGGRDNGRTVMPTPPSASPGIWRKFGGSDFARGNVSIRR